MISMVDKQKIIQYWHVEKKSEVEIAAELGISRNTVRRYLKSFRHALEQSQVTGLPEPVLSDFLLTIPKYNAKNRGKRKLTKEIMQSIDVYLQDNAEKCRTGKRKQISVSYTHLRAHETRHDLVCRLLLEKK